MKIIYTIIITAVLVATISGILLSSSMKQMGTSTAENRLKHQGRVAISGLILGISLISLTYLIPFAILNLILNILHASVLIKKVVLGIYILFAIIHFFISLKELKK